MDKVTEKAMSVCKLIQAGPSAAHSGRSVAWVLGILRPRRLKLARPRERGRVVSPPVQAR